jgi:hypothetical protein
MTISSADRPTHSSSPTCRFDIDPLSTTLRPRASSNRARFNSSSMRPQATQNTNPDQRGRPYASRPATPAAATNPSGTTTAAGGVGTSNTSATSTAATGGDHSASAGGNGTPQHLPVGGISPLGIPLFLAHLLRTAQQPEQPAQGGSQQSANPSTPAGGADSLASDIASNNPPSSGVPSDALPSPTDAGSGPGQAQPNSRAPITATFTFSILPETEPAADNQPPISTPTQPSPANASGAQIQPQSHPAVSRAPNQPPANNAAANPAPPGFDMMTAWLLAMRTLNGLMNGHGGMPGPAESALQPNLTDVQPGGSQEASNDRDQPVPTTAREGTTEGRSADPQLRNSHAGDAGSTQRGPGGPSIIFIDPTAFSLPFGGPPPPPRPSQQRSQSADAARTHESLSSSGNPPARPTSPAGQRQRKTWVPPAGKLTLDEWVTLREKALHWRCDDPVCLFAPPEHLDDVSPAEWDDWKPTDEACMPLISMGQKHAVVPDVEGQRAFNLLACPHSFHASCVRTSALSSGWWTKDEDGRRLCRCPRCRKEGWLQEADSPSDNDTVAVVA